MCAWASVSQSLPHNSATFQFQLLESMQMDAEYKKELIDTLNVWVGALEEAFGGWVVPQRAPLQKVDMPSPKKEIPVQTHIFSCTTVQAYMQFHIT